MERVCAAAAGCYPEDAFEDFWQQHGDPVFKTAVHRAPRKPPPLPRTDSDTVISLTLEAIPESPRPTTETPRALSPIEMLELCQPPPAAQPVVIGMCKEQGTDFVGIECAAHATPVMPSREAHVASVCCSQAWASPSV